MGYHLTADIVSRAKGQSMVARAAYNLRECLTEERTGERKDYSRMRDKPLASFVFSNDPELRDAGKLWNFYDEHETRKNAQLGISFIASLPWQMTDRQREFIVKDFMREQFQRKGVAAQADIHRPDRKGDDRNYHVHILTSLKAVNRDGLGERVFKWEDREKNLAAWRMNWAERGARELEKQGFTQEAERWRYGHLTNEQQREKALERGDMEFAELKAREATKHLGPAASAMERRGEQSDRADLNQAPQHLQDLEAQRDALDRSIQQERHKLAEPPRTPEDAKERAAAVAANLSKGMRARNQAPDRMKRDGYEWWQRSGLRRSRGSHNVGAEFWEYWREHVWGDQEKAHEPGGMER